MKYFVIGISLLLFNYSTSAQNNNMIIRLSEIEIDSNYLKEYKAILKEESAASVKLEPGVISIFPMYEKENLTRLKILEIYSGREAYESHLKTAHFLKYKTTTLKMVKSLRLIDMKAVDPQTMKEVFKKLSSHSERSERE